MQRHTITVYDTVLTEFFHTSLTLGQTGVSQLGPQTGVVGLLFDAACVHLEPQTSWCHSGSDLDRAFLPGEGVERIVQDDIS